VTSLFAFILSLLCVGAILRPLLVNQTALPESSQDLASKGLVEQKERFVQVLKDLELDFATGKLTQDDYTQMRNSISLELAGILKKLDG